MVTHLRLPDLSASETSRSAWAALASFDERSVIRAAGPVNPVYSFASLIALLLEHHTEHRYSVTTVAIAEPCDGIIATT